MKLPIVIKGVCERRPDRQLVCEFLQAAWDEVDVKFNFTVVSNAAERLARDGAMPNARQPDRRPDPCPLPHGEYPAVHGPEQL